MKRDIHLEEDMHKEIDIYGASKENLALDVMKRFRITREIKKK